MFVTPDLSRTANVCRGPTELVYITHKLSGLAPIAIKRANNRCRLYSNNNADILDFVAADERKSLENRSASILLLTPG
jgi:hypothetical protein